jgi:hypothetical protein
MTFKTVSFIIIINYNCLKKLLLIKESPRDHWVRSRSEARVRHYPFTHPLQVRIPMTLTQDLETSVFRNMVCLDSIQSCVLVPRFWTRVQMPWRIMTRLRSQIMCSGLKSSKLKINTVHKLLWGSDFKSLVENYFKVPVLYVDLLKKKTVL